MSFPGLEPTLDSLYCKAMLKSLTENLPKAPRSTELFLYGDKNSQGNIPSDMKTDEEYVLPDEAVAIIFSYLPIKDVFRFGFKLSRTWLDVWKKNPLVLHDAQLLPDYLKEQLVNGSPFRHNISKKVTRVLDMHPGPVACMRLEYTTRKGGSTQLRVWIEKVIAKTVSELVLFSRWPQANLDLLPNNILRCAQLRKLTLCFFKIPELSLDDTVSLAEMRAAIIAHCKVMEKDIIILLMFCNKLNMLSLGHLNKEVITICSTSLSLLKLWNCRFEKLFIVDCPELTSFAQGIELEALHETQVSISTTPGIELISHLYLDQQTLYVDEHQIMIGMKNHPQYQSLRVLSLGVRFKGNYQLDVVRDLLISFPNLVELNITRMDPDECYFTACINWKDLIKGIRCVEDKLKIFYLLHSGLNDTEIELAESILLYASNLREFVVLASECTSAAARGKLKNVIWDTTPASGSLIKLELDVISAR